MDKLLYGIKDNYSDLKAKFGGYQCFNMWSDKIPDKYIDTKIRYQNCFYFSNEKDRDNFENELYKQKEEDLAMNKLYYHYQLIKYELGENGIDCIATTQHFYGTLEEKDSLEEKANNFITQGYKKLETRIIDSKQIEILKEILKKDKENNAII